MFSVPQINETAALPPIASVWFALGGGPLRRGRAVAFWRRGDGYNVSLSEAKGCYYDHVAGEGGGTLSLVEMVLTCDRPAAWGWLRATFNIPDHSFTPAERRAWARRRARAEREADSLTVWRRRAIETLRFWRNHFWDTFCRADRWLRSPEGCGADFDDFCTLPALRAVTDGQRLGDTLNEALERLEGLEPAEVRQLMLRRRMHRRAA